MEILNVLQMIDHRARGEAGWSGRLLVKRESWRVCVAEVLSVSPEWSEWSGAEPYWNVVPRFAAPLVTAWIEYPNGGKRWVLPCVGTYSYARVEVPPAWYRGPEAIARELAALVR